MGEGRHLYFISFLSLQSGSLAQASQAKQKDKETEAELPIYPSEVSVSIARLKACWLS